MRNNRIREQWEKNEAAISAWLSIGNSYSAEIAGMSGVDCVTVDLQHGMADLQSLIAMLQAISSTPATPVVRVPGPDPATIQKVLDTGAYGVICPMINSVAEAQAFVAATRYAPKGSRSFGPARGLLYGGADYFQNADATLMRLAMIETAAGVAAVEDICAVDGLDGIFIGPNDLGISLGTGPAVDPIHPDTLSAIGRCLEAARSCRRHAGIFCANGAAAARWRKQGFDFLVPGSDVNHLKTAMAAEIALARQ